MNQPVRGWKQRAGAFLFGFLGADKAPYMLTLFVAAVAWTVVRSTDRLAALPLVEYQVDGAGNVANSHRIAIRLRNITSAVKFPCFGLTVASLTSSPLRLDVSKSHSVVIRGAVLARVSKQALEADVARFTIQDFAPGADIEIGLYAIGADAPRLLVSGCGTARSDPSPGKGAADAEPILVHRSVKSVLAEYELYFLWGGLILWLVLLAIMFSASERAATGWRD